jgi:hypothetical protein
MVTIESSLLSRFENEELLPADFNHASHVSVAFEMLDKYEFFEACHRYASGIRAMVQRGGIPEEYNATMTLAFLSLIAERKTLTRETDAEAFVVANHDLLCKDGLSAHYSSDRLTSTLARQQFLLP